VSVVFDTQAVLILYLGEKGAEQVANLLQQVLEQKRHGYMNVVNLAELYYILSRKSRNVADEKERNLRSFGVKIVSVQDNALWKEAALLKAKHSLSLADAFAAATAKTLNAKLITGSDPEFDNLDIQVKRIGTLG
jgi:ribonuclease VapC